MGLISSQLSAKEMALLCRELATSSGAGIPLLKSLQMASEHGSSTQTRNTALSMETAIRNGATLSDAARQSNAALPNMFVEVLSAGEAGGKLDEMLADLAAYYESTWKMQRAVVSAMIYPLLQLLAAWFLGTFALGLVSRFDINSQTAFSLDDYVRGYFAFQTAAVVAAVICCGILVVMGRLGLLRWPWAIIKTALFPLRHVSNKFAMARFFRTLALLIGSGLNIRQCIERSAAVTLNPMIEKDLLRAVPIVMQGGTLTQAFAGCRYINRVGHEMIIVGEKSGKLDETLRKLAEYYYNEAQTAVAAASKILFVATILIVGVIIGGIVIYFWANLYGSLLGNI